MKKTRTENVAKNVLLSTVFQVIAYIVGFVSRTIFIRILGEEYLGLNGLFTNILTMLSFAELGIGTAIVYSMYKPLAEENNKKLKQLIEFYKNVYFKIGMLMLFVGIILAPFLNFFIKATPNIKENLYIIYIMFVINSSISYFFSYRTSIISADQKNYLIIVYNKIFHILRVIVQIFVIILFHSYYLYLIIEILSTLFANLLLSIKSKKMYPELINTKKEKLPKKEKESILVNVKSLFIYKIGSVVLNGTDNIIISKFLGLVITGLYSNYQLLISAVTEVVGQITNSFTASIGNLNSSESSIKKEEVFYKILYFTYLLFGICSITFMIVVNDFVSIWIGKKYLLDFFTISMIVGHFYVNGVQYASFSYRTTLGLFNEAKWNPIIAIILNIPLSIIFAKTIGLAGVFLATIIARFFSAGIIDPIVVYKNEFKKSSLIYYMKYFKYLIFVLLSFIITYVIVNYIPATNLFLIFVKTIICVLLSAVLLILPTFKSKEFKGLILNFKELFNKIHLRKKGKM